MHASFKGAALSQTFGPAPGFGAGIPLLTVVRPEKFLRCGG